MRNKWLTLLVTTGATAQMFMEQTVMPIALPSIETHFNLHGGSVLWIVNLYLLSLMSFLLVGGRMNEIFGIKRIYLLGFFFSGVGSLVGGFSFSLSALFFARILQGIGAAFILPTTSALLVATFPPETRARAFGFNTGISAIFLTIGPAIGGMVTQLFSWRAIFFMNLPLLLFAMIMSLWLVKGEKRNQNEDFHFLGALSLILSIVTLVIALLQGIIT